MKWKQFVAIAYPEHMVREYAQKNIIHRIHRWIGLYLGYILYHLGFSANLIDISRTAISLVALYLLSLMLGGYKWWPLLGAFLLYGQNFLDAADGSVARVTGKITKLGKELDEITNSFSRGAILILIGAFTGNNVFIILNIFSASMLINFREKTGVNLPAGFMFKVIGLMYRFFLFIQTMLFIVPLILVLVNIFGLSVLTASYIISLFYLFLSVFWIMLCLLFKNH